MTWELVHGEGYVPVEERERGREREGGREGGRGVEKKRWRGGERGIGERI